MCASIRAQTGRGSISPRIPRGGGGGGGQQTGAGVDGEGGVAGGYRPDSGLKSKIINISERFL